LKYKVFKTLYIWKHDLPGSVPVLTVMYYIMYENVS